MQCDAETERRGDAAKSEPSALADGLSLVRKIVKKFQTNDVFEIARRLNISITYGKWFPVTLGEFDKKNKRITVNLNAEISFEKIIAHELGHCFLEEILPVGSPAFRLNTLKRELQTEKICDDFAEELLRL